MSLTRYSEYKESGFEWIGNIPGEWGVIRLKQVTRLLTEKTDRRSHPVALENIESWSGRFIETDTEFEGDGIGFCTGDILFGKLRPYLAKAYLASNDGEAVGDFHVLRPGAKLNARFAQYQLLTREFIAIVDGSTFGAKMPRASWDFMGNMPMVLPSLIEQQVISDFLDHETSKIDLLIAEQVQLIALLKEKCQAVITHAVTKGLNPAAPMKDSGIEWLGKVPAHWSICHVKRLTSLITDGAHVSPETDGGEFCFVSTKDVSDEGIDFDGSLKTSPASYESLVRSGCQPVIGDVLFSKDGTIGRTVVVNENREFVVASSLIIIRPRPNQLVPEFLNYLCQSDLVRQQVESFVKGAGLPRLSIQNLLKVIGVFPTTQEQHDIATFLDQKTEAFRSLTTDAAMAVSLLQDRRTALISAAVTGKIDVRKSA